MEKKLIYLDDAIEKMKALFAEDVEMYGVEIPGCFPSDRAIEALRELPTHPDIKIGKWIDGYRSGLDGTRHWYRYCSECEYERDDDNQDKDTPYCPNCGSRLESEDFDD